MNVLIVNTILIGDPNATGVTMEHMLFPMEGVRYLQFCVDYRKSSHEEIVDTVFLTQDDALSDRWIRRLQRKREGGQDPGTANAVVTSADNGGVLRDFCRGLCDALPCRISPENLAAVRRFSPQAIYTMGDSIRVIRIATRLSEYFQIPVVFHCMDDWRATKYRSSLFSLPFHYLLRRELKELHKHSFINLGICKKMADVYAGEYHTPYSFAGNCISRFNNIPYSPDPSKAMKILFSGGLHFHRSDKLRRAGELIEKLNEEGYRIDLCICAPKDQAERYAGKFKDLPHTACVPYVAKDRQMENLMSADVLLHVESDEKRDQAYMKYSFSTKLPEYFSAGRAVVGFGDGSMASISYIEDMGCGFTAESIGELEACLVRLYSAPELRKKFAGRALHTARSSHSKTAVQYRIRGVFEAVIERAGGDRG